MRDLAVHLCWMFTHFARSLFETNSHQLYEALSTEVKVLQSELHRAHRLIEGYNAILSRDDSGLRTQLATAQVFTVVITVLTLLLWYFWVRKKPVTRQTPDIYALGDTGGSSSDSDVPNPKPLVARASGPLRPSTLGKGKR